VGKASTSPPDGEKDMKNWMLAAFFGATTLVVAPVALAHDRDVGARMDRGGSSRLEKSDRDERDHGRNRGPDAHGRNRGGDHDGADDLANGQKRRSDGSLDDGPHQVGHHPVRPGDDIVNGVKRRGDGSIDDNSTHSSSARPKGV
jgi:hypothetical protein